MRRRPFLAFNGRHLDELIAKIIGNPSRNFDASGSPLRGPELRRELRIGVPLAHPLGVRRRELRIGVPLAHPLG